MKISLLTFIQDERPRVVVPWHGDHSVPVESPPAALVHSVTGDGGRAVTGPV